MKNHTPNSKFYEMILNSIGDGVYFVDQSRTITFWNKGAERITGYPAEDVVGTQCFANLLNHIDQDGNPLCHNNCPLADTIHDGQFREADVYLHHKESHRVPVSVRVNPMINDEAEVVGAVETFSNANSKMDLIKRIQSLEETAYLDELTQLPNRRFLESELLNQFEFFKRTRATFGILFMDIDHFKHINDHHGHDVGDKILQIVATTLKSNSRSFDLFGRWGGEEFVGILPNVNQDALQNISERMRMLISKAELKRQEQNIAVTISIGATLVQESDTIPSLLKRADHCLYQSKHAGRNRVTLG